jgi:hypothetical protein
MRTTAAVFVAGLFLSFTAGSRDRAAGEMKYRTVPPPQTAQVRQPAGIPAVTALNHAPFLVSTPQGDVLYPPIAMSDNGQFIVIVLPDRILRSRDYGVSFQISRIERESAKARDDGR